MNELKSINIAWDKVLLARDKNRFRSTDIINSVFREFIELHGDCCNGDDTSIVAGIAYFENTPVTIIGQQKGKSNKEMIYRNYGMTLPDGYRKALRLMKQAEKFRRPIICLIDTPGAYPGKIAEERGQSQAIASCLYEMSNLNVPIISIIIGEGGSGGALALGIANKIIMLENAVFSVASPEACASILWKDSKRATEAAKLLKLTSYDLLDFGIVDRVIKENSYQSLCDDLAMEIGEILNSYSEMTGNNIKIERQYKFRNFDINYLAQKS